MCRYQAPFDDMDVLAGTIMEAPSSIGGHLLEVLAPSHNILHRIFILHE